MVVRISRDSFDSPEGAKYEARLSRNPRYQCLRFEDGKGCSTMAKDETAFEFLCDVFAANVEVRHH